MPNWTVVDKSTRMEKERLRSKEIDDKAVRDLEWSLGTGEKVFQDSVARAKANDLHQVNDFIAAATFQQKENTKLYKTIQDTFGFGGPLWKEFARWSDERVAEGNVIGQQRIAAAEQNRIDPSNARDPKIGTFLDPNYVDPQVQKKLDKQKEDIKSINQNLKALGYETGIIQPGEEYVENQLAKDQADVISLINSKQVLDQANKSTLTKAIPDPIDATEIFNDLSSWGHRAGAKQALARHLAKNFAIDFPTWQKNNTTERFYRNKKGEEVSFRAADLSDDPLANESTQPYLIAVDAYQSEVLSKARAMGLSASYVKEFVLPTVTKQANDLKKNYRTGWAKAKNLHWKSEVASDFTGRMGDYIASGRMGEFRQLIPSYITINQGLAKNLGEKDWKQKGVEWTKELMETGMLDSYEEHDDTGIEYLVGIRIPITDVPWVKGSLADENNTVSLEEAYPHLLNDNVLRQMSDEIITSSVNDKIARKKAEADKAVDKYVSAINDGLDPTSDAALELRQDALDVSADFPKTRQKLDDNIMLRKNFTESMAYVQNQLDLYEGNKLNMSDLDKLDPKAIATLKAEGFKGREWDDIFESKGPLQMLSTQEIKDAGGILTNFVKANIAKLGDSTQLLTGNGEQVIKDLIDVDLPKYMRIANERSIANGDGPLTGDSRNWVKQSIQLLQNDITEQNTVNALGNLPQEKYTFHPTEGFKWYYQNLSGSQNADTARVKANDFEIARVKMINKIRSNRGARKPNMVLDPKHIPQGLSEDFFKTTPTGQIGVKWHILAADKEINPKTNTIKNAEGEDVAITAYDIRDAWAAAQKPPINLDEPEFKSKPFSSKVHVNDIQHNLGNNNVLARICTNAGGSEYGITMRAADAVRRVSGGDKYEHARKWDKVSLPAAMEYATAKGIMNPRVIQKLAIASHLGLPFENLQDSTIKKVFREFCTGGLD